MRWNKPLFKDGDKIIRSFFAWLPVCIWNTDEKMAEYRWLEKVTIEEVVHIYPFLYPLPDGLVFEKIRFIDS